MKTGKVVEKSSNPLSALNLSDFGKNSTKLQKIVGAYALGKLSYETVKQLKSTYETKTHYSVTVDEDDEIYQDIHKWLISASGAKMPRNMSVRTTRITNQYATEEVSCDSSGVTNPFINKMTLYYDDTVPQSISMGGHKIRVFVEKPELIAPGNSNTGFPTLTSMKAKIRLKAKDEAGLKAVLKFLEEFALKRQEDLENRPKFFVANRWNEFSRRSDLDLRTMETVILRQGQKERIISDLSLFLQQRSQYGKLGIPYHRGYLFYGPPGSGKTSIAKAVANHFKLDVYYIPLGDLKEDASLMDLVYSVKPGSVLLLEDIDVFHAAKNRDEDPFGISLSGLLNALDGIGTPQGLITMMTTNNLEALDQALIRPGRVDFLEKIDYLDSYQVTNFFRMFYGVTPKIDVSVVDRLQISPADLVEILKHNMASPTQAEVEFAALSRKQKVWASEAIEVAELAST